MPLFVLFVFGSVVIGAGAMLAPAWNTTQPRIGLSAALALALVMGGAVFWAMLFGWSTLVIDYLLFALVTVIFLGGTLSYGQTRAEKRGETLSDADQGWPGLPDLLFFAFAGLIFAIPALVLPAPLDTDAQGFGYLGLMARMGGGFDTLAPWHPEITYLYSPGFTLLIAYLSQQLGQGMHTVQLAVGAVLSLMIVWLAFDLGSELQDKRLGRAMGVAALIGVGTFTAFMDSHFTALLGLVFALAFIIYVMRYLKHNALPDAIAAGLLLGAVVLAHADTTIILALGYVPWLGAVWLAKPRPTLRTWLVLAIGVPVVALIAISPWLLNVRDLMGSDIVSPFTRNPDYWRVMVLYHGVLIVPIAIIGAIMRLRKRDAAAILGVIWLVFILEFSTLGLLERLVPGLIAPLLRYDYPFSIAWHGPIIPYIILGGIGLLWLWERLPASFAKPFEERGSVMLVATLIVLAAAGLVFNRELLSFSKGRIGFFGSFASEADIAAMTWLRQNTPPDARILNFPGTQLDNSHEGDWVPVITERDSVYYRWQPFYRGNEASIEEQDTLRAFWENPAETDADLLADAGVDYVIVPQIVNNPDSLDSMFRWRMPDNLIEMESSVEDAPYLELVFEQDGAQVYAFRGS